MTYPEALFYLHEDKPLKEAYAAMRDHVRRQLSRRVDEPGKRKRKYIKTAKKVKTK